MNDSQKRREQLLKETRHLYRSRSSPAVHPRYSGAYRSLYGQEEEGGASSLGARVLVSLLLFVLFAGADYENLSLGTYAPDQIAAQIQYQPDLSAYVDGFGLSLK